MTITIPYEHSKINVDVHYDRSLVITLPSSVGVYEPILESVYKEMNTEDFIKTLDYDQMQDISEYFETIKDKK